MDKQSTYHLSDTLEAQPMEQKQKQVGRREYSASSILAVARKTLISRAVSEIL